MKIPAHLNALRALEAVARHRSFAAAAAELCVTPAAVSQQIRNLEARLGSPLFVRRGGYLEPTAPTAGALGDLRAGFDRLATGWERLADATAQPELTVTVSATFASKWLLPRIERFQRAYPAIKVLLDTDPRPASFHAERLDVGVRYGAGEWKGLVAVHLMDEVMFPVCAPDFPGLRAGELMPEALAECTLIHDLSMAHDPDYPTWRLWLDASSLPQIDAERGLRINDSATVVQAAIDGRGVALARSVMVNDDLAAGRLIRPFADKGLDCPLTQAYYLVYRPECADLAKIRAFRDWLRHEVAGVESPPRGAGSRGE